MNGLFQLNRFRFSKKKKKTKHDQKLMTAIDK